jgi:hypothetical protein
MVESPIKNGFRKNFSQRNGFAPMPSPLNPEEITSQLRLEFQDLLFQEYQKGTFKRRIGEKSVDWEEILGDLWVQVFKRQRLGGAHALCLEECRKVIQFHEFHQVFTLMEDLATRIGDSQPNFQKEINQALIRNQTPYILQNSPILGWGFIQTGSFEEKNAVLNAFENLKGISSRRSYMCSMPFRKSPRQGSRRQSKKLILLK